MIKLFKWITLYWVIVTLIFIDISMFLLIFHVRNEIKYQMRKRISVWLRFEAYHSLTSFSIIQSNREAMISKLESQIITTEMTYLHWFR